MQCISKQFISTFQDIVRYSSELDAAAIDSLLSKLLDLAKEINTLVRRKISKVFSGNR